MCVCIFVQMISTTKSRTFQSGIAFLYGFLPNLNPSKLHIEAAMDTKMCTKTTKFPCACPAITRLVDTMSTSFRQTHPEFIDNKKVRSAYKDMTDVLGVDPKEMPRGTHVYDVNMVHACHGLPLPGQGDKCIPPRALVDIAGVMNSNGMANQKNAVWKRVARIKMMPLLHDMYRRIQGLAENKTRERFVLYSGHDTTLEPLVTSLGVTNGTWPPYASRLALETYSFEHGGHKHYLLRVVFNGNDVTSRVIFCRPESNEVRLNDDGMCSFEDFEDFIQESSMKDLNTHKNYRELCAETIAV